MFVEFGNGPRRVKFGHRRHYDRKPKEDGRYGGRVAEWSIRFVLSTYSPRAQLCTRFWQPVCLRLLWPFLMAQGRLTALYCKAVILVVVIICFRQNESTATRHKPRSKTLHVRMYCVGPTTVITGVEAAMRSGRDR